MLHQIATYRTNYAHNDGMICVMLLPRMILFI